ncbi:MAG TPA: hypothetical protein VN201_06660, partial [Roseateles sp.]|nr:hypothetical protein [Roseateles sp.]
MPFRLISRTRSTRWKLGLIAGIAAAALVSGAQAQEAGQAESANPATDLRLSGFGSLGLSQAQAPDGWGYRRELTQSGSGARWRTDIDSRLGLQLNYTLGARFELVAQAIAKKRGAFASDTDALEWGYASFRPNAEWTLRAGRVNVDAFLMADYRNVGYAFLTARPPVELYARLPTTLDGADAARSWFVGDAQWRVKLMAGSTRIGDNNFSKPGRLNSVLGAMVSREEGAWLLRASLARARIDFDLAGLQPALAAFGQLASLPLPPVNEQAKAFEDRLTANGIRTVFAELGVRYELADWQWSVEAVRVSGAPLTVENSAYATVGRRFGAWTPYVSLSHVSNTIAARTSLPWQAALTPVLGPAGAMQAQQLA